MSSFAIELRPKKTLLTTFAALFSLLFLSIPIGSWVSLVVLPFGLLIYSLASSRDFLTALLSRPLMLLLGGASYSVYLLQAPVRDYVRVLISRFSLRLVVFGAPLTPLILILFSILVFRIWEEPMRHSIRRWLAFISRASFTLKRAVTVPHLFVLPSGNFGYIRTTRLHFGEQSLGSIRGQVIIHVR